MAKQDARVVTPRVRFSDFGEAGKWTCATLGELFVDRQETGFTGLPLLSLMDKEGIVPQEQTNRKDNSNSNKSKYLRVVPGDIAYNTMRMWEGRSAYVDTEGLISPAYTVCAPKEGVDSRFFSYYFRTQWLVRQFRKYSQGLVKDTLNLKFDSFKRIEVVYPSDLQEQQRIADCLMSLDEVIAAQGRKVEALKAHKRGLMEQLFPREGETRPRLRFAEFRDAPEWKQEALGETTDVLMCKRIFASETNTVAGVPFYKIGTLGVSPDAYISKELFEDYKARYSFPRVGEILITCSGTVGKCVRYDGSDAYFQDSNIVWIDNPAGAISNDFLFALISNVDWSKLNSTTITRIYGPDLRGLPIKYPKDGAEQQRIADCLASLDSRINAETDRLAALKTHKQGLMQQLFPAPEAMGP